MYFSHFLFYYTFYPSNNTRKSIDANGYCLFKYNFPVSHKNVMWFQLLPPEKESARPLEIVHLAFSTLFSLAYMEY